MTEQELRQNEFLQGRIGGGIIKTYPSRKIKDEASMYSKQSGNFFDTNLGWTAPQFGLPSQNNNHGLSQMFQNQLNDPSYGSLWSGMKDFGSAALDKVGEWAGNQGVTEWAKIGLGIKDQFFDRPKMIDSYLKQGSALNALRGSQMAAINENIAGAKRAEARTTAMQLRNLNAQRPQGTPEFTQLTPSTYV